MAGTRRFDNSFRRVGKGAHAPCPPFACTNVDGGHASLCPPYGSVVGKHTFAFSRHCARALSETFPPSQQRAQGRPGARCTHGLVCNVCKKLRTRAYRFSGEHPAFPAQWLYGLYVISPVSHALLPPSTPDSGRQDHTTSPYASVALVSRNIRVHRIPPRVRGDRERPSCRAGRADSCHRFHFG